VQSSFLSQSRWEDWTKVEFGAESQTAGVLHSTSDWSTFVVVTVGNNITGSKYHMRSAEKNELF
jgi:hypothetical protein